MNTFVHDFDILCNLDNAISNEVLILDGFNCILRKDRNSFGGGVMIYMSNMLRANRRFELEPQDTECIWIEIENLTFNYLLCCIYRPPNADSRFWHNISWSIEKAQEISDNIIIVGDLNIDFLNIPRNHQIREILSSNNLVNKIREPTRISNTTRTLIDPILTTNDIKVVKSGTLEVEPSVSDHKATYISVSLKFDLKRAYKRKVWEYKNADLDKLNALIHDYDWQSIINDNNPIDLATKTFSEQFLFFVRECIPEKKQLQYGLMTNPGLIPY